MKKFILILISLLLFSCEKENSSNLEMIKSQLKTDNLFTTKFILKNDTVIKGKLGTQIFIPKDLFSNYTNGQITLELKEFYSKEDMILNGLSTITNQDELLESSGMIYINFTESEKQLEIKNGKLYNVILPSKSLNKSNIYTNKSDSIFRWELEKQPLKISFPDIIRNYNFGITVDKTGEGGFFKETEVDSLEIVKKRDSLELLKMINDELKKDEALSDLASKVINPPHFEMDLVDELNHESVDKYEDINNNKKLTEKEKKNRIENRISFFNTISEINTFSLGKLGWINIDRISEFDTLKDITITNNHKLQNNDYVIFYNYIKRKSLINHFLRNFNSTYEYKNLRIAGKMKVIIYTNEKDKIYYDTFYLDKNSKTNFEINLKETTLEKLKTILITP